MNKTTIVLIFVLLGMAFMLHSCMSSCSRDYDDDRYYHSSGARSLGGSRSYRSGK
jgi:hypothetical protein